MNGRRYEGLFLIDNNRATQAWDETVEHVEGIIKKHSGTPVKTLRWDERKLAFEIKGHRRGTYLLIYFDMDTSGIADLRRDLQLSEQILRNAVVRLVGEMLEGPGDLYADGAAEAAAQAAASDDDGAVRASAPGPISLSGGSMSGGGRPAAIEEEEGE